MSYILYMPVILEVVHLKIVSFFHRIGMSRGVDLANIGPGMASKLSPKWHGMINSNVSKSQYSDKLTHLHIFSSVDMLKFLLTDQEITLIQIVSIKIITNVA